MKLTTRHIFDQIKEFWKTKSKKNQKRIIGLLASCVVIAVIAAIFLNNAGYVALYNGLTSSETGEIVSRLNEMGIDFKVKTNGTILVPKDKEAEIVMTMASEGYPQSALNYDIFSSNSGFMTTEYEKKQYLLFQLQNRLQDAIKTIKGISGAIVTISLPEEDAFVLQEDKIAPSASVVLDLAPASELSTQQVKGIESLISKSVPGLESTNVAIVSNAGDVLNNQYGDDGGGVSYTKLELEKNISANIEKKVMKLLSPVFGYDAVRVAVNALVDINKKVSEQTTYAPVLDNSGIIANQDSAKENAASGSSAGGVPGTASNSGVATYQEPTNADNTGNYSESSSTNYLNNQTVEQVQREGYEITDITVAVLIGNQDLSTSEIEDYRTIVAYAAGVSPDKVVISNAVFASVSNSGEVASIPGSFIKNNKLFLAAIGAAVLIVILVAVLLIRRKQKKAPEESVFANTPLDSKNQLIEEIVLSETREQNLKKQIKDFASSSPDVVAQLIRTWLKEDEDNE